MFKKLKLNDTIDLQSPKTKYDEKEENVSTLNGNRISKSKRKKNRKKSSEKVDFNLEENLLKPKEENIPLKKTDKSLNINKDLSNDLSTIKNDLKIRKKKKQSLFWTALEQVLE